MRRETIAVHGGFENDPATRAVAAPIYRTVAYEFDSANHAAALINHEAQSYRYSHIVSPINTLLGTWTPQLEGCVAALSVAAGHAALYCFQKCCRSWRQFRRVADAFLLSCIDDASTNIAHRTDKPRNDSEMMRLIIGIKHCDDLIEDLIRALSSVVPAAYATPLLGHRKRRVK
jgi:O-acetylhomoserine/O-acetylserine sulfhydrylase-like pyridoxal-dependent enzyme